MKIKTTYLSELDATRIENEQLSRWLATLQEDYTRVIRERDRLALYIERQSGSRRISGVRFKRHDDVEFAIDEEGKAIICPF